MKTLYLVRHAKSSWNYDVIDHQRPLKKRGDSDAKLVSEYISTVIEKPDLLICSDALRALSTAVYFKENLKISDTAFQVNPELYDFSGQQVLNVIHACNDNVDKLMVVGHNHAFTSLANVLGTQSINNVPTCGFVMIEFETKSWQDIKKGETKLCVFPRDLKRD